jgi:hypothetical protein
LIWNQANIGGVPVENPLSNHFATVRTRAASFHRKNSPLKQPEKYFYAAAKTPKTRQCATERIKVFNRLQQFLKMKPLLLRG